MKRDNSGDPIQDDTESSGVREDHSAHQVRRSAFSIVLFFALLALAASDIPEILTNLIADITILRYEFTLIIVKFSIYIPMAVAGAVLFSQYLRGENDIFDIFGHTVQRLRGGPNSETGTATRFLRSDILEIKNRLTRLEIFKTEIDPKDELFTSSFKDKIRRIPYKDLVSILNESLERSIRFEDIPVYLSDIEANLQEYKDSNRRQLSTNLMLGVVGTISSIVVAFYLVAYTEYQSETIDIAGVASHYVPWISLIVVIQFMSIFFFAAIRQKY